jgi:hypothetical protein
MLKRLLIVVVLVFVRLCVLGNSTKDSLFIQRLIKLASFGNEQLKTQIASNAENNRKNLHGANNYIINFSDFDRIYATSNFNDLTTQLSAGSSYSGTDVLSAANISELNAYLLTVNNGVNPDIYIAVNLRLGLIVETKSFQPEQLGEVDKEVVTNKITQIRVQNFEQIDNNHKQIKTYFDNQLANGVPGEYVLFTWGKFYKISEDPANKTGIQLKLSAGAYYTFYYDKATSITSVTGEKITAYIKEGTDFLLKPRKTSADLVVKYKSAIDGLKAGLLNKDDVDKLLLEGIIKQHNLKNIGKQVLSKYYRSAKGDGAIDKLTDLAVYVDNIDTAIYNGYVEGVRDRLAIDNYSYWFEIVPPAGSFNKDNIANIQENIKKYYEAFLYIKEKANKGVITKSEFKDFFDKYLTWGGDDKKFFHPNPLVLLSADEKVNILKAISKQLTPDLINRSIQDYARDEDLVINVLKTTPKEKTLSILVALKSTKLLYQLIDKFTFDDFDDIVEGLSTWIFYNYPAEKEKKKLSDKSTAENAWLEYLEQKRAVYFNDNYFGRRNTERMDEDGNIHITVNKWFNSTDEFELAVDPYKYVIVRFENDFKIAGSQFYKKQPYILPALAVYMLYAQDTRTKWGKTTRIIVDVALCAIGVGEISAAIEARQWGRLAIAGLDVGFCVGDLIINGAFQNEIQQTYPHFFENWQKVSLCYGLARLATVGIETAFRRANIESYMMKTDQRLSQSTRDMAAAMNRKLQDPENFAEFVEFAGPDVETIERQVTDCVNQPFKESRQISGDAANLYLYRQGGERLDFRPPYMNNTPAFDISIKPGTKKLYCVEYVGQTAPGGWLTDQFFSSIEEMREKLALIDDFKTTNAAKNGDALVIREYEVIQQMDTRMGIVGEQYDAVVKKTYWGGANQYEFNKFRGSRENPTWSNYMKRTGNIVYLGKDAY